jgi:hypothetical protein
MIDQAILDAYVARFPDLRYLAANAQRGDLRAIRSFAQNACRLEAPPGVSAQQIWRLAGIADGQP